MSGYACEDGETIRKRMAEIEHEKLRVLRCNHVFPSPAAGLEPSQRVCLNCGITAADVTIEPSKELP